MSKPTCIWCKQNFPRASYGTEHLDDRGRHVAWCTRATADLPVIMGGKKKRKHDKPLGFDIAPSKVQIHRKHTARRTKRMLRKLEERMNPPQPMVPLPTFAGSRYIFMVPASFYRKG